MYLDDSVNKLTHFEGSIRFMYLDTVGLVTVGVGEMLPNPAAACQVLFNGLNGPASEDEIIADFRRVKAMQPGLGASTYYVDNSLTVLPYDIKNMLLKHVIYFDGALAQFYRGYMKFPDGIKVALIDLAFNLGMSKLEKEYPTFNAAVNR